MRAIQLKRPSPTYERYKKRKHSGGYRWIYATNDFVEKEAQKTVKGILENNYEPRFHNNSYGFRPRRSVHQAMTAIINELELGCKYIVKLDVKQCFDSIPHGKLLNTIIRTPISEKIYPFVERTLYTEFRSKDGRTNRFKDKGFMQGMILAPLYCNIYLNKIDWWIERNHGTVKYIRYADDMLLMGTSRRKVGTLARALKMYALQAMKLEISGTEVIDLEDSTVCFLGFLISKCMCGKAHIEPAQYACDRLETKVITALAKGNEINVIVRGWENYYGISFHVYCPSIVPIVQDAMGR